MLRIRRMPTVAQSLVLSSTQLIRVEGMSSNILDEHEPAFYVKDWVYKSVYTLSVVVQTSNSSLNSFHSTRSTTHHNYYLLNVAKDSITDSQPCSLMLSSLSLLPSWPARLLRLQLLRSRTILLRPAWLLSWIRLTGKYAPKHLLKITLTNE